MQGAYVNGVHPKTKKALREAIASAPETVELQATSLFGNEYGGPLTSAPDGSYYICGPDPHVKRNWYATVKVDADGARLTS